MACDGATGKTQIDSGSNCATVEEVQAISSVEQPKPVVLSLDMQDEREKFFAVLQLYQKGLDDLRTFVLKRSFLKQFDSDKLFDKLEAKVVSVDFLERLGSIDQMSAQTSPDGLDMYGSWDIITETDLDATDACSCLDCESYVIVNQDDFVEGMACFMAKYVACLPQTKEMTPQQLQSALSKAFGVRKKGRLDRLWSSSKALYTAASWGATAVSLYNNPAVVQAASKVFWASIHLVKKYV